MAHAISWSLHESLVDRQVISPYFDLEGRHGNFGPVLAADPTRESPAKDDERGGRTPSLVSRAHAKTLFPSMVHQVGNHARRM